MRGVGAVGQWDRGQSDHQRHRQQDRGLGHRRGHGEGECGQQPHRGEDTAGVGGALGISAGADSVLPGCIAPGGANCDSPNFTLSADGNVISGTDASGIFIRSVNNLGSTHLFLNNNTVGAPLSGFREGIQVHAGSSASDLSDTSVCLKVTNNTAAGSGGADGIGLRKQGTSSTTHAYAVEGMAATSSPGVETYVDGLNPGASDGIDGDVLGVTLISATSGFTSCTFMP